MDSYRLFLSILLALYLPSVKTKDIKEHKTIFHGEQLHLSCQSSYSPIWNLFGKDKVENLAVGGKKHKKFENTRYSSGGVVKKCPT